MAKVSVASHYIFDLESVSEAWRVVVSQHCSVRMPLMINRRMPRSFNHPASGVPASALWYRF